MTTGHRAAAPDPGASPHDPGPARTGSTRAPAPQPAAADGPPPTTAGRSAEPVGPGAARTHSTPQPTGSARRGLPAGPRGRESAEPGFKESAGRAARAAGRALRELASGARSGLPALLLAAWAAVTALTSIVGVGLVMAPGVVRALHALAARERRRLGRWGPEVVAPEPPPTRLRLALVDPTTRRELRWLTRHATLGLLLGLLGVVLPVLAVRDTAFPLYWKLVPKDVTATSLGFGTAHSWPDALAVSLLGIGWIVIILGLTPGMCRLQAEPGRRLLAAGPETDLSLRVAELTATRAAALDAHAVELRRIERSLHDGTQNRLVSVTVLVGAARRMVARDPDGAGELLERAQSAAEQALAELRTVARSILPPVLADRGLAGALAGLAANCPVPCRVDVDVPERCAASVEATAYFVVAEALTNVAEHSGATHATVTARSHGGRLLLRVEDDGHGGAGAVPERDGEPAQGHESAPRPGEAREDVREGTRDAVREGAGGRGAARARGGVDAAATGRDADRAADQGGNRDAGPNGGPDGADDAGRGADPYADRQVDPSSHPSADPGSHPSAGPGGDPDAGPGGGRRVGRGDGDRGGGTGLIGIRRRVAAHDGTFRLASPRGGPTVLEVDLPCAS